MTITIVIPSTDESALSGMLRRITGAIDSARGEDGGFGLGGSNGYGADWSSPVFDMKPFCWCDSENCAWCSGEAPNFWHKQSGFKVQWYKYIGRGMEVEGEANLAQIESDVMADIAQGTPTRSAETTGSVGEADGGPVSEGNAPC